MYISQLELTHFRHFDQLSFKPGNHINVIHGGNGAGKTSILEALYWMSHGRSFRQCRGMQLIQDNANMATIFVGFNDGQNRSIGWQKKRQGASIWKLDRQSVDAFSKVAKSLPVQWLDTSSHREYASGPKVRRRFFDWGLFHVEQDFHHVWSSYQKALVQRNAALKQRQLLAQWDQQVITWGNQLHQLRQAYFERYRAVFLTYIERLLLSELKADLNYDQGWGASLSLEEALKASLQQDQHVGFTTQGPHRADIIIETPNGPAHQRLSQGQQKMLAYAWRLAQGEMLNHQRGSYGVLLIDDLTAELDPERRSCLLHWVSKQSWQCFITAIHLKEVLPFFPDGQDYEELCL